MISYKKGNYDLLTDFRELHNSLVVEFKSLSIFKKLFTPSKYFDLYFKIRQIETFNRTYNFFPLSEHIILSKQ